MAVLRNEIRMVRGARIPRQLTVISQDYQSVNIICTGIDSVLANYCIVRMLNHLSDLRRAHIEHSSMTTMRSIQQENVGMLI